MKYMWTSGDMSIDAQSHFGIVSEYFGTVAAERAENGFKEPFYYVLNSAHTREFPIEWNIMGLYFTRMTSKPIALGA